MSRPQRSRWEGETTTEGKGKARSEGKSENRVDLESGCKLKRSRFQAVYVPEPMNGSTPREKEGEVRASV